MPAESDEMFSDQNFFGVEEEEEDQSETNVDSSFDFALLLRTSET